MSHFTCLVITKEEPTDGVLHKTLLPYHEYECTGYEEYLQDVDVTDEVLNEYNRTVSVIVLADGSVHSRWDNKFYAPEKDEHAFPRKVFNRPEGSVEKELTADEARVIGLGCANMKQAATAEYGDEAFERDGKWYRRTNPNRKWDWWVRGGRWKGMLLAKPGASCFEGSPEAFGNDVMRDGGVDSVQLQFLDLEKMRDDAGQKAAESWDIVNRAMGGEPFKTWVEVREEYKGDIEAAREAYANQLAVKAVCADKEASEIAGFEGPDQYRVPRSVFIEKARNGACQTFAILKEGQWYEKGSMGWWGIVTDEKDTWSSEFAKLLDNLPPETWLTVVDCHI